MNRVVPVVCLVLAGCAASTQPSGPASLGVVPPSYYSDGPRFGPVHGPSHHPAHRPTVPAAAAERPDKPPPAEYGSSEMVDWQAAYVAGLVKKAREKLR